MSQRQKRTVEFPLTDSEVREYGSKVSSENWVDNETARIDTGGGIIELHEEEGHFTEGKLILDDPRDY